MRLRRTRNVTNGKQNIGVGKSVEKFGRGQKGSRKLFSVEIKQVQGKSMLEVRDKN